MLTQKLGRLRAGFMASETSKQGANTYPQALSFLCHRESDHLRYGARSMRAHVFGKEFGYGKFRDTYRRWNGG